MMTLRVQSPERRMSAFDRMFEDLWRPFPFDEASNRASSPQLDIIERDDEMEVQVNLPGMNPNDVNIEFDKGYLTISAETTHDHTDEGETYMHRERYHGVYRRSLRISDNLDVNEATATFENGVLYLTLPKKPESQPHRIPVNGSLESNIEVDNEAE